MIENYLPIEIYIESGSSYYEPSVYISLNSGRVGLGFDFKKSDSLESILDRIKELLMHYYENDRKSNA